jgi:Flp pilus assembly protein TadG
MFLVRIPHRLSGKSAGCGKSLLATSAAPQWLKPLLIFADLTARLKARPFKTRSQYWSFRNMPLNEEQGAALMEFAITLPLLVVFVVGIYDFSGAFNQKQKIEQAAQEGAIVAGAQPMSDIQTTNGNPDSLQPVVFAIFNSLAGSGVLSNVNQGACKMPPSVPARFGLAWTYTISGCSSGTTAGDNLVIIVNRGCVCAAGPTCTSVPPCASGPPVSVGTVVTITYPYHWRFNSLIQLLVPGATYAATTLLTESATVHNQM